MHVSYVVISESSKETFEEKIEKHLENEWRLYGPIQVTISSNNLILYHQALLKYYLGVTDLEPFII